jgi:hypothetical protein
MPLLEESSFEGGLDRVSFKPKYQLARFPPPIAREWIHARLQPPRRFHAIPEAPRFQLILQDGEQQLRWQG